MALSNENGSNGMVMPVVPYGNNSGSGWGNGFSGDGAWWLLVLFLFMFNGNGWGNGWNNGGGYSMHSYKDRIIANLENKMQTAPTEADKAFIEGLLGFAEGRV